MSEWLVVWGVSQATWSVFRPILQELAEDVAKDAAKSYVGKCFKSVFSVVNREPLTKATGLALKELLELIESELIRAEIDDEHISDWIDDVRCFSKHDNVRTAVASLFLQPGYRLDPKTFAAAWEQLKGVHTLPETFSWPYLAKRFTGKIAEIRQSSIELRETFESLAKIRDSDALQELAGLPPNFNLDTYREALFERYRNLDFGSLDITGAYYDVRLWSIFVAQSVREYHEYYPQLLEKPKDHFQRLQERGELLAEDSPDTEKHHDVRLREYVDQPLMPVLEVLKNSAMKRIAILGDPGSGKSSLLRFLALSWARIEDANLRYTQPLPLLVQLRDYNRWIFPSGKSFSGYLHAASTWHRLNQQTLEHLLRQPNRVVLLLDGLDEVFDRDQRHLVVNDIHRFSNDYKHVRIIVTSRVVGYKPQRLRDAEFQHFMLQDLSSGTPGEPGQIDEFLDRWHDVTFNDVVDGERKCERLRRAINYSKPIAMLAGNPLLLTMMAILNRNQELPRERVDLYQQATRVLLQQWDTERALEDYPELRGEVDLRAKTAILRSVAYAMQNGSNGLGGNIISGETLTTLIEDYLHDELHFKQSRAAAGALVRQLRERNFVLCFLGADSFAFVHRTFLEYFCAAEFVHRFHVEKTIEIDGLTAEFDKHCKDDDWREVLRLICSQIDEQFVGRIVNTLSKRVELNAWDGYEYLNELILAGYCLCEVRNAKTVAHSGRQLLEKFVIVLQQATSKSNSDTVDRLFHDIVELSRELGSRWPGKDQVDLSCVPVFDGVGSGDRSWASFVANLTLDRDLILKLLVNEYPGVRIGATIELSEKWPDDTTRKLLKERAVHERHSESRLVVIYCLANTWPDDTSRKLLEEHAAQDEDGLPRAEALRLLADKWPDIATRKLLEYRAVQDMEEVPRRAALIALAGNWPDDKTRKLLEERAVRDTEELPRSAAFKALADNWPDEATRKLIEECAVQHENIASRFNAFKSLIDNWPNEATRKLIEECVVQDEHFAVRFSVLFILVDKWPDDASRKLLEKLAILDINELPRRTALDLLSTHWPDNATRKLLEDRAVQDEEAEPRRVALMALAYNWPDNATRKLLEDRAVKDMEEVPRSAALIALAGNWPDDKTRKLLEERAVQDTEEIPRSTALFLADNWPDEPPGS